MSRLAIRGAVGVLWAALAAGCLGGQTGQPTSDRGYCEPTQLAPSANWSGTTVEAAAKAFEVPYTGSVQWQVEARTAATHTPVDFPDSALLAIVYTGASASTNDCFAQLTVPVSVTLSTSQSGIEESGDATLSIRRSSQGLAASLQYESKRIRLDATLPDPDSGGAPSVTFDALDPSLPGASASFTEGP